ALEPMRMVVDDGGNRPGISDRAGQAEHPRRSDAEPPGPIVADISEDILDHAFEIGMPRPGDHMPLLVFATRDILKVAMQPHAALRLARPVRPLTQDIFVVGPDDGVELPSQSALDVEIDAAFPIDAEVTEQVGPRGAVFGQDAEI